MSDVKKYRRRVSDERVERAAKAIAKHQTARHRLSTYSPDIDWKPYIKIAQAALEADAEVIKASPENPHSLSNESYIGSDGKWVTCKAIWISPVNGQNPRKIYLQSLSEEWEEIQ